MNFKPELVAQMKAILAEKSGKEITDGEAQEALRSLAELAKLGLEMYEEDVRRKKKLEAEPDGFVLSGGAYSCKICGYATEGNWYDKYGISCMACRDARRKRIIPVAAYKSRDNWYAMWELEDTFGVKSATVRKFIRKGKLKVRVVENDRHHAPYYLFMISDNKDFLPKKPKTHAVEEGRSIRLEREAVPSLFIESE